MIFTLFSRNFQRDPQKILKLSLREKKIYLLLQRNPGRMLQSVDPPLPSPRHILLPVIDKERSGRGEAVPLDENIIYFGLRLESPDLPGDDPSFKEREKSYLERT